MTEKISLKRFKTDKLFRDKVQLWLKSKGINILTTPLGQKDLILKLKEKLIEEAHEVEHSDTPQALLEELADVLEVINALAKASEISIEDIEEKRLQKREARGGFENGCFVKSIDILENNPEIEYYLTKPNQYQQINNQHTACIFCQMASRERKAEILAEFKYCFVIKDQYPVSNGHILIIPHNHTSHWFTTPEVVQLDIMQALTKMKLWLDEEHKPDGYNIGANCGEFSGQTIMHLHIHLIPRYKGDMEDPRGGVRGVIPDKQKY